jgi:hypothetical protein
LCALTGVAHADDEQDALTHLNAGVAHYERGELSEARADFVIARDLFPQRANPHRWLGLTEARLDHCAAAVAELDEFLNSVPPRDPRVAEAVAVRDLCRGKLSPGPAPPSPTPEVPPAPTTRSVAVLVTPAPAPPPRHRYWIIAAVLGPAAAVGVAIGLGVGLTRGSSGIHTYPPVSSPP